MNTMKSCIRKYVELNNEITLEEVQNKLIKEECIETTNASIRTTLYMVRKELEIKPPIGQVARIIKNYVEGHNNFVTFEEVKNYILNEKHLEISESTIRKILKGVLKKSKGKLKSSGLKQILRDYLSEQNDIITFAQVKDYVRNKKNIEVSDHNLRNTLYFVRKEAGIKIKSTTITEAVRDYFKVHKEEITFAEVKDYILYEIHMEASESSIRNALRIVLEETGRKIKKISIVDVMQEYFKEHKGKVTIKEMKNYILNERNIKVKPNTIKNNFYKLRKEYISNSPNTIQ